MKYHFTILLISAFLCATTLFAKVKYDFVKVTINNKVITNNGIDIRSFELARAHRSKLAPAEAMANFREQATNQLIEEALLDIRADELGIIVGDDELDAELERFIKQRKISQLEFEELLERQKVNLADFRKTYRNQIRRNKVLLMEIRSKIQVDEASLKAQYEKDSSAEILIRARHVLLLLDKSASAEKVEETRKRALQLRERIVSGESFDEIAMKFSEDPSAKSNKGDLGFFKKSDMVEAFSKAAFSLEPGVISMPVRTTFGFHLIEVLESKKETKASFESVKNKLMQQKYQKEYQDKYTKYLADLRKKAKITIK